MACKAFLDLNPMYLFRWSILFPTFSLYLGKTQRSSSCTCISICPQGSSLNILWGLNQPSVPAVPYLLTKWNESPQQIRFLPLFGHHAPHASLCFYIYESTQALKIVVCKWNTLNTCYVVYDCFFITEFCTYHLCLHLSLLLDYKCLDGRDYEGFIFALPALSLQLCLQLEHK